MRADGKTRENVDALAAWLDGIALTKPVTLEDKKDLMALVKQAVREERDVRVDVYSRRNPDEVYLRIEYKDRVLERVYAAR